MTLKVIPCLPSPFPSLVKQMLQTWFRYRFRHIFETEELENYGNIYVDLARDIAGHDGILPVDFAFLNDCDMRLWNFLIKLKLTWIVSVEYLRQFIRGGGYKNGVGGRVVVFFGHGECKWIVGRSLTILRQQFFAEKCAFTIFIKINHGRWV